MPAPGLPMTWSSTTLAPSIIQIKPTYGKPCESGWMNVGAGYCKKKNLGIF